MTGICASKEDDILDYPGCMMLDEHNFVTKELQDDSITVAYARNLVDSVINWYPNTKERLGVAARINENSQFESAIFKVQTKWWAQLGSAEDMAIRNFHKNNCGPSRTSTILNVAFAQRVQKDM